MGKLLDHIKSSLGLTAILSAIFIGFNFYAKGWSATVADVEDIWWIFIALPAVCIVLLLFHDLKLAAHDFGKRKTVDYFENKAAMKDRIEGTSYNAYSERLKSPEFSQREAQRLLSQKPRGLDAVIQKLQADGKLAQLLIPTYIYENGLPGEHLFREIKGTNFSLAKVEQSSLCFYRCERSTYDSGKGLGHQIGRIPLNAIREIEVVDNDDNRRVERFVATGLDKAVGKVFSVTAPGIKAAPTVVRGATLLIKYITPDGILFAASFKIPSGMQNNKLTQSALQQILSFRADINKIDGLAALMVGASFIHESPLLGHINKVLGYVALAAQIAKLLDEDDSAVPAAKATAEMLATFTQNEGFRLTSRRASSSPSIDAPTAQTPPPPPTRGQVSLPKYGSWRD